MSEVKDLFTELNKAFDEFKSANDVRLKAVEKNGVADPLLEDKVNKANEAVTELEIKLADAQKEAKNRMDKLELELQTAGLNAGQSSGQDDIKNEAALFFSAVQGKPVENVDVDAYVSYKQAFNHYLRRGDRALPTDIKNALSVGSDPDGGQWVPASTTNKIIKKMFDTSPMRQIANVVTIGTDRLEIPKDLAEGTSGGWVGETASRAATATPEVGLQEIPVHEQYASPKATQKLIDDAQFPVENWLRNKIADKLISDENTAFVSGNGVMKPRGFTDYSTLTTNDASRAWGVLQHVLSGSSGALPDTPDELIDITGKLKAVYRRNAVWVMNRFTRSGLRKLNDSNTQYYLISDLSTGGSSSLLGFPIVEFDDMDSAGANNLVAAFGDFNTGYQVVDRAGIRVLRDPFTDKPYILYYTTKRVGGDVTNFDAIKILKCTA